MQGEVVLRVLRGGRVNAGQVVAVEHHGDWAVDGVKVVEELLGGFVGALHALGVFRMHAHLVARHALRVVRGVEFILAAVQIRVGRMVLHRHELDVLGRLVAGGVGTHLFDHVLVGLFVGHIA